jgi:peptidoglycan/LPS O-acetylase OafA/YrhL
MTFRPQLDGLRGLFVAAVFLFHSQFLLEWA